MLKSTRLALKVQLDSTGSVVLSQSHSPHNWHFLWWLGEPYTTIPKLCFGDKILKERDKGLYPSHQFIVPNIPRLVEVLVVSAVQGRAAP